MAWTLLHVNRWHLHGTRNGPPSLQIMAPLSNAYACLVCHPVYRVLKEDLHMAGGFWTTSIRSSLVSKADRSGVPLTQKKALLSIYQFRKKKRASRWHNPGNANNHDFNTSTNGRCVSLRLSDGQGSHVVRKDCLNGRIFSTKWRPIWAIHRYGVARSKVFDGRDLFAFFLSSRRSEA